MGRSSSARHGRGPRDIAPASDGAGVPSERACAADGMDLTGNDMHCYHDGPSCARCGGPADRLLAENPDVWACWACSDVLGRDAVSP
jgi:hypothetical protein